MEPTSNPSPRRFRPAPVIWALMIGIPLLLCCGIGYVADAVLRGPYVDSVVWGYEGFYIVGSPSGPSSLHADEILPPNLSVERQEDGRRVELSTITWNSANAMSARSEPFKLSNGEHLIDMLDEIGHGSSFLTVTFENQRFKSLTAHGVRIHNEANGESLNLAKWTDVERVFGKPKSKDKSRHHVPWGR